MDETAGRQAGRLAFWQDVLEECASETPKAHDGRLIYNKTLHRRNVLFAR